MNTWSPVRSGRVALRLGTRLGTYEAKMSSQAPCRVLCFGDSLTEGYTFQPDGSFYPFSKRLKELLSEHFKDALEVDTMGVSGERVVTSMGVRLESVLKEAKQPYDWIMILGGTNDLGYNEPPDTLLKAICQMHDRARASGARTLVLALPEFALELNPNMKQYRENKLKVNAGLKEYCERSESRSVFVDLHTELPHAALSSEERRKYWCDGLHMTPKGYDKMAEVIFSVMKEHL